MSRFIRMTIFALHQQWCDAQTARMHVYGTLNKGHDLVNTPFVICTTEVKTT